jgi:hypothetical protein
MYRRLNCAIDNSKRGETLELPRGQVLLLEMHVTNRDGTVYDLSTATVTVRVFHNQTKIKEVTAISSAAGVRLGVASATISLARSVEPGSYWFEVWLTDNSVANRIYPATSLLLLTTTAP